MRIHLLVVVAFVSVAGVACDENLSSLTGPTPNLEPTFSSIQSEIFEKTDSSGRSACTNCHTNTGRIPPAALNLNHNVAYAQLVNAPTRSPSAGFASFPAIPQTAI